MRSSLFCNSLAATSASVVGGAFFIGSAFGTAFVSVAVYSFLLSHVFCIFDITYPFHKLTPVCNFEGGFTVCVCVCGASVNGRSKRYTIITLAFTALLLLS